MIVRAFVKLLVHDRMLFRLLALWSVGVVLNLSAWTVGHHLLPPGLLRGTLPGAGIVPHAGSFQEVFWPILLYNLGIAGGLITLANLFRVGRVPLGYLPVLLNWTFFGLFLGTNSFELVRARETAPSLVRLLGSSGFIELSGLTFLAVATIGLFLYRQESWLRWTTRRERSWQEIRLRGCELLTLATGVLLLVASAAREALSILS